MAATACACFIADPHDKKCHISIKEPQMPTHPPELYSPELLSLKHFFQSAKTVQQPNNPQ